MGASLTSILKYLAEWRDTEPSKSPFKLVCSLSGPATPTEIIIAWPRQDVPGDLLEFWRHCRQAELFKDVEYGQWGLRLLNPVESARRTALERSERSHEYRVDDVVIGEFIGDNDLLVLAPSEQGFRRVMVAMAIDNRADWWPVGTAIADFLARYLEHQGEKYWEP